MKKTNRTSSSKDNLMFGFSFLIFFISRMSFSMRIDNAIYDLIVSESFVGTRTALSIYLSTIFSCGTPIILWTEANLSKSIKNLSIKSITILNSTCWVLNFLNSINKISIWSFDFPYNSLYLAYWTWTSTVTAHPKLYVSQTSWTYFNT